MSIDRVEPLLHVPQPNGEPRPRPAELLELPEGCLWTFVPTKRPTVTDEYDSVRVISRASWFHDLILTQATYLFRSGHSAAAPHRTLIVESQVEYDQELAVLVINGGLVMVLAGRTNCMERLLMIRGHETFVASSGFSPAGRVR